MKKCLLLAIVVAVNRSSFGPSLKVVKQHDKSTLSSWERPASFPGRVASSIQVVHFKVFFLL